MKDEHSYTVNAQGIDSDKKAQADAVSELMNAVTARMELGIKRIDAYAKWFATLTTLLAALFAGFVSFSTNKQISEKNKKIEKLESTVSSQSSTISNLEKKLLRPDFGESPNTKSNDAALILKVITKYSTGSLALSAKGDIFAVGGANGAIYLRSSQNGNLLGSIKGNGSRVSSVSFSPSDLYLASGDHDGSVRIWEISPPAKPILIHDLGPGESVFGVVFSGDSKSVFAEYRDGLVKKWNVETGNLLAEYHVP